MDKETLLDGFGLAKLAWLWKGTRTVRFRKVGLTARDLPLTKLPTVHERTHAAYTNLECKNHSILVVP